MTGVVINKKTEVNIDVTITDEEIRELILETARKKLKRKLPEGVVSTLTVKYIEDDGSEIGIEVPSAQVNYTYTA